MSQLYVTESYHNFIFVVYKFVSSSLSLTLFSSTLFSVSSNFTISLFSSVKMLFPKPILMWRRGETKRNMSFNGFSNYGFWHFQSFCQFLPKFMPLVFPVSTAWCVKCCSRSSGLTNLTFIQSLVVCGLSLCNL